jgi:hypothetical protein
MWSVPKFIAGRDGELSTSKLWRHIAFGVATYIMIIKAADMDWELLMVYMAIVASNELAKLVIAQRSGVPQNTMVTTTTIKETAVTVPEPVVVATTGEQQ